MNNKKNWLLLSWLLLATTLTATIPPGYYAAAKGKKGAALKTALYGIIHNHTNVGYDGLFAVYAKSDVRKDGKIWDMYSCTTNFNVSDHNGNYHGEGDVYNREHSLPQSWFKGTSDAGPLKADAFHVVPTDGYVNNRRSNYPFGETSSPTYSSNNGFSKVGPCSVSGYSGTVFEPNDQYKGDFARNYFYVATAYEGSVKGFSGASFNGTVYPAFSSWSQTMFLRWATNDPVSEKETDRNDAIYGFQHNRNPFIDFPGLEQYIWGDKQDVPFDPDNYNGGTTPAPDAPAVPTFSPAGGVVEAGTVVTITCSTQGATIHYSLDNAAGKTGTSPVSVTLGDASTSITAYAEKDGVTSASATATYTILRETGGENTYYKIATAAELEAGRDYLIVCEGKNTALAEQNNDIRSYAEVTIEGNAIETETGKAGYPYALTLGGKSGAWTLYDAVEGVYLALTSNNNKLHATTDSSTSGATWSISFTSGFAAISSNAYGDREIQYNASAPRFATYTGSQQKVALYKRAQSDAIATPTTHAASVTVMTLQGRTLRRAASAADALSGLPSGIYIVGGHKVLVP